MGGLVRVVVSSVWLAGLLACRNVHVLHRCGAVESIESGGSNVTRYTKILIVLWVGLIVAVVAFFVWPGPLTLYYVLAVSVLIVTALVQKRNGA